MIRESQLQSNPGYRASILIPSSARSSSDTCARSFPFLFGSSLAGGLFGAGSGIG